MLLESNQDDRTQKIADCRPMPALETLKRDDCTANLQRVREPESDEMLGVNHGQGTCKGSHVDE